MKSIVAGHVAVTATEFVELSLGIDLELFTGPAAESAKEQAARLDVAKEVLAELRETDPETAEYAASLLRTLPMKPRTAPSRRRAGRRPATAVVSTGSAVAA
ncbi:hypothetical protein AB0467_04335 [Streptomyces sp. NPDC052095]|uniref:hypothetical protein n=1 Tax=unclassified Streptomyces TaxID=2593676 RepID=UPI003450B9F2